MGESRAPIFLSEMWIDAAPNEVFGRSGNDFLAGNLGNDRLDGGLGFDSGTGGYHDRRIDWITSVERAPTSATAPDTEFRRPELGMSVHTGEGNGDLWT